MLILLVVMREHREELIENSDFVKVVAGSWDPTKFGQITVLVALPYPENIDLQTLLGRGSVLRNEIKEGLLVHVRLERYFSTKYFRGQLT